MFDYFCRKSLHSNARQRVYKKLAGAVPFFSVYELFPQLVQLCLTAQG